MMVMMVLVGGDGDDGGGGEDGDRGVMKEQTLAAIMMNSRNRSLFQGAEQDNAHSQHKRDL